MIKIHRKSPASLKLAVLLTCLFLNGCGSKKNQDLRAGLKTIGFKNGEIALCGADSVAFGKVDFEITCAEAVTENFNLATALLHSFEYDEAEKAFARVLEQDPECVMAYWGVAMSNFHTLWSAPEKVDLIKGSKTIALARKLGKKSVRESDYLEAIGAFYDDWAVAGHKTRMTRFEKAMEHVYLKYPDDKEAAAFYALALTATADPKDKTFSHQRKAGEILNKMYLNESRHPGIAHYIIHTYDYPELAAMGLRAARAYAAIAPASAHAQHMPSHIFTRLGIWDESESSNLNSVSAARCYTSRMNEKSPGEEELHGMDYLVYAYLQQGRDVSAKRQVDLLESISDNAVNNSKSAYAYAAIPSRFAVERKQWKEAAALQFIPQNFAWKKFPWESSVVHFAKLLGYVHLNELNSAKLELAELKSCEQNLIDSSEQYRATQVRIQINASEAWVLFKSGKKTEAVELMTRAADMEDATTKPPVTPGEIIPSRELLGDLLMEMGQPGKALQAYEEDLIRHPNRFNGLAGAANAALASGNKPKAIGYSDQLVRISDNGECKRPELASAKKITH